MFIRVFYEYECFVFVDNNECIDLVVNGCFSNVYCINIQGSYMCFCFFDYILKGDGKICECKLFFWFLFFKF